MDTDFKSHAPARKVKEDIEIHVDHMGRIRATTQRPSEHEGRLELPLEQIREALERLESHGPSLPLLVATGATLYESLFSGEIQVALREALSRCRDEGAQVRVRMSFELEEHDALPWEAAYDPVLEQWLAVDPHLSLVRHPHRAISHLGGFSPPLRLLVVTAEPKGLERLNPEREVDDIQTALKDELSSGRASVKVLAQVTPDQFEEELRRHSYHIVHVISHGLWDAQASRGMLALCDEDGHEQRVGENALQIWIKHQRELHLVVLNTCLSAGGDPGRSGARGLDWFRRTRGQGLARALISAGVPAVIGMQHRIRNDVAISFARKLYRALGDGMPVDESVQFARGSLQAHLLDHRPGDLAFASPVMFMRTRRGEVFRLTGGEGMTPSRR